jgi:hypothetical protein
MNSKTRMHFQRVFFLLLAASFTLTGFAKKPDFSGKWKLNESKSTLNTEFSFAPVQVTITQDANSMTTERVSIRQGNEVTRKSSYTLDGKESVNEGYQGSKIISIAKWADDGKSLTIVTTMERQDGGERKIETTYRMDGKNLVIENKMEGGRREGPPESWVFDKQ